MNVDLSSKILLLQLMLEAIMLPITHKPNNTREEVTIKGEWITIGIRVVLLAMEDLILEEKAIKEADLVVEAMQSQYAKFALRLDM